MNRDFEGVDIDLLADYIGGALDGTPDNATVAGLIARDETWRSAYEALAQGMAAVGTELSALGAGPEPMPADVSERLDRAFRTATGARVVAVGGDERPARAVPATARARRAGTASSRARRARRWAVPIAVAAVALAFAGFGVNYVLGLGRSTTSSTTSSRANAPEAAGRDTNAPEAASGPAPGAKAAPLVALPPADRIGSSGTDYRHATLTAGPPAIAFRAPDTAAADTSQVAGSLDRLRPATALLTCLNAIATENGAGPISVQSVDYARYAGAPAVVVRFTAGNGSWAWASGPDCGAPGVGASRLDAAKVG